MPALDSALLASLRAGGANKGRPFLVGHKTANYTVLPQDAQGGVISNLGAVAGILLILPAAKAGQTLHVHALAAQVITVAPLSTDQINAFGKPVGVPVANTVTPAVGDRISLMSVKDGEWLVSDFFGDWS